MPDNHSPRRPRGLGRLQELESLIVPYFNYVAAALAVAVLATIAVGEVSQQFDSAIRPLYAAFTLILVIEVLRRIYSVGKPAAEALRATANQEEALQHLAEYVKETSFQGDVRILLYAGTVIDSFLTQLIHANVRRIELLICDPAAALNRDQANRIRAQIDQRKRTLRSAGNVVEVRAYKVPASLRGVYLKGEKIAVSWYTYESRLPATEQPKARDLDLHGPSNAMIIMDARTPAGRTVADFFDRTFAQLWSSSAPSPPPGGAQS
jgi:hypothetical protein